MNTHWPDGTPRSLNNAFNGPAWRAAMTKAPEPSRLSSNGKRKHRRTTPAQSISLPGSYAPIKRS